MSKKDKPGYKFSHDDPSVINSFIGDLAFSYPDELRDAISRLRKSNENPLEIILQNLQVAARRKLTDAGIDADLGELQWIDEYDLGVGLAGARQVLFSAFTLPDLIDCDEKTQIAFEMLVLITSAIKADLADCLFQGLQRMRGQRRGGQRGTKRLIFVEKYIFKILEKHPTQTAINLWSRLKNYKSYASLDFEDAVIYVDGERIYEFANGKTKAIHKSTFFDYVKKIKKFLKKRGDY